MVDIGKIIDLTGRALPVIQQIAQMLLAAGAMAGAWYAKKSTDRNLKGINETKRAVSDNTAITEFTSDKVVGVDQQVRSLQGYVTKVQSKHAREISETNRKLEMLMGEFEILKRQLDDKESELPTLIEFKEED